MRLSCYYFNFLFFALFWNSFLLYFRKHSLIWFSSASNFLFKSLDIDLGSLEIRELLTVEMLQSLANMKKEH